jgi:hypothetical protein
MKTIEDIKEEWQKHNRDHGLSWNEVAELVNEVASHSDYSEAKPLTGSGLFNANIPEGFRIDYMASPYLPKSKAVLLIHPELIPQHIDEQ